MLSGLTKLTEHPSRAATYVKQPSKRRDQQGRAGPNKAKSKLNVN